MTKDEKDRRTARKSLMYDCNRYLGICEVLRIIYDLIYDLKNKKLKEEITERLVDGMVMSKKIVDRLMYYKAEYNDTTGHNGKNIKRLWGARRRKKLRRRRLCE
jgi:hypothetical protein